jgi:hypothetical protein
VFTEITVCGLEQPPFDSGFATRSQVRRAGFGSAPDHGHVDEVSAAVLAVLAMRALHREDAAV